MIAVGLALLFFGYRVKKVAFFLIWFILGFNLTTFLMPTINNMVPQIAGQPLWQNLIPITGTDGIFDREAVCRGNLFCSRDGASHKLFRHRYCYLSNRRRYRRHRRGSRRDIDEASYNYSDSTCRGLCANYRVISAVPTN